MSQFDPNSELLAKAGLAQQDYQRAIYKYYEWLFDKDLGALGPTVSKLVPNAAMAVLYEIRKKIVLHIESEEATEFLLSTQDDSAVATFKETSGLLAIEEPAQELVSILNDNQLRHTFNQLPLRIQFKYLPALVDGIALSDAGKSYLFQNLLDESVDESDLPVAHVKRITDLKADSSISDFTRLNDDLPLKVAEYFHEILPVLSVFENSDRLAHLLLDFLELYIPRLSEYPIPRPSATGTYLDDVLEFLDDNAILDKLAEADFSSEGPFKAEIRALIKTLSVAQDGRNLSKTSALLSDLDFWEKTANDARQAHEANLALAFSMSNTAVSGPDIAISFADRGESLKGPKFLKVATRLTAGLDMLLSAQTLYQEVVQEDDEYAALGAYLQFAGAGLGLAGTLAGTSALLGPIGFAIGLAGLYIYMDSKRSELEIPSPPPLPDPSEREDNLRRWLLTSWFGRENGEPEHSPEHFPPFGSYDPLDMVKQINIFYSMLLSLNVGAREGAGIGPPPAPADFGRHRQLIVSIAPALVTAGATAKIELLLEDGGTEVFFDGLIVRPVEGVHLFTVPEVNMSSYQEQRLQEVEWTKWVPADLLFEVKEVKVSVSWKEEAPDLEELPEDKRLLIPFALTEIKEM